MDEMKPVALEGHWETEGGAKIAADYHNKSRADLCMGHLSDMVIANGVFMASRHDLDLITWQTAAKERIRWLSAQLAATLTHPAPTADAGLVGWQPNDGHWVEAIHTAHLAQDFFNEHVREHVLVEHLEKTNPDFAAKLEAASDALYAVYNTVAQLAPE